MSDPLHPVNKDWVMHDPLVKPPPRGNESLLLILPGGTLGIGPWFAGCHAWGYKPVIPESVKQRLVAAAMGRSVPAKGYTRAFAVGKTYLTKAGKPVKIVAESTQFGPHYTCVQGDDGEDRYEDGVLVAKAADLGWRYDRDSDAGRCTASAFDMSDPRNLVVGSEQPEVALPDGLTERSGKYFAQCRACEREYELCFEPENFSENTNYCGGSPRCLP